MCMLLHTRSRSRKIEDKSVSKLLIVAKQMKDQITQMNEVIKLLCEERNENK